MNLTIRQLLTFREVMRAGTLSEAARSLGRTQPSVSALISGLEDELQFKLFERQPGKIVPRPEARYVLEECEEILTRLERTKVSLSNVKEANIGKIRIACYPAASNFLVPQVMGRLLRDKPDVEAALIMRTSKTIEDMIASQQFDLGILETPVGRASFGQLDFNLSCRVAVNKKSALAKFDTLSPTLMAGEPLAMLFDEHPLSQGTRKAYRDFDVELFRRFELQTFLPGLNLVKNGLCSMICDPVTALSYEKQFPNGELVFRNFEPVIGSNISIVWPKHRPQSRLTQELIDLLAEEFSKIEAEFEGAFQEPQPPEN